MDRDEREAIRYTVVGFAVFYVVWQGLMTGWFLYLAGRF